MQLFPSPRTVPAEVKALTVIPKEYSLSVTWNKADNEGNVTSYVVLTEDQDTGECVKEIHLGQEVRIGSDIRF